MPTRLLLLIALLLGVATPPRAGVEDHCRDHAMQDAVPSHHHAPTPAQDGEHHCPPAACLAVTHCVAGGMACVTASSIEIPDLSSSRLAARTSHDLRGRDLEPPTPPPNRIL